MHTLKAAADAIGVHPRTLRRWIKGGKLGAAKVPGRHGPTWALDAEQLDTARTLAARDVAPDAEPPAPVVMVEGASADTAEALPAPAFDAGALFHQLGELLDAERAAARDQADTVAGAQLDALRVQVEALRDQVATLRDQVQCERRARERAERQADAAGLMVAELRDALAAARDARTWKQLTAPKTTEQPRGRVTLPFARSTLRAVAEG